VVLAQRERCKTLVEMVERSQFFYQDEIVMEGDLAKKHFNHDAVKALHVLAERLEQLGEWTKEGIHNVMTSVTEELGVKLGLIAQPVRIAVTGGTVSPSIDVTLSLLGKVRTIQRLRDALSQMEAIDPIVK
jgi:glutamyl-tRNA synthetase